MHQEPHSLVSELNPRPTSIANALNIQFVSVKKVTEKESFFRFHESLAGAVPVTKILDHR